MVVAFRMKFSVRLISLGMAALRRDWRAGELRLIAAAIVVAVGSLTTVGFLTDRVQRAIELHATELLAADLVLESPEPITAAIRDAAAKLGLESTRTVSFRSMAAAGERMELVELKAVEDRYPIRGRLRGAAVLFGEEQTTADIPARGSVWPDQRLIQSLGVAPGDRVNLGEASFNVDRILTYEPDRGGDFFNIAPRLLMNLDDLPSTGLILPGSRASYRLLLGGADDVIGAYRATLEQLKLPSLRVHGIRDARPELRRALERAEQFLGLAVIVSVALCGLAIAMASRRYVTRHFDACAVMRCIGADQRTIMTLYSLQILALAAGFSLLGCAVGYLVQLSMGSLLQEMSPGELPAASPAPMLVGIAAGVIATAGFALPQIWRLGQVPPLRVFRRDLAPPPPGAVAAWGSAVIAVALLTPWRSGEIELTAYVLAGLIGTAALLCLGCAFAIRLANRLRSRVGLAWRFGLANIARRAAGSMAQVVGIGLGATVLILLILARTDLLDAWRNRLPPRTPNYFLINIQPDEADAVREFLFPRVGTDLEMFPMVRGRLVSINGRPVIPDGYEDQRAARLAAREFNLSWASRLQSDNRLVMGDWWRTGQSADVFYSVEVEIGETLGINLGDELVYRIAGREVTGTVRNTRSVEWDSFKVNFFVMTNPGALDGFPATYISSFYLSQADRALLRDLVRRFPSVTVIDVAAILDQVRAIIGRVSLAVEFVSIFTLLAGLIVLVAALQSTHDERRQEAALLRSLGAGRGDILAGLAAEFAVLGAIAGILSAVAAAVIEWMLGKFVFQIPVAPGAWLWVVGPAACIAMILAAGLAGTRSVLSTAPAEALRAT